ncbi:MAG: MotA/TolQ/ExbB proton channel family protein [Alphaproteobacteria bacterium]|nr:MotA/TolQ/ExbB proton channel family protein [Alphaproteobacteria bacterium]
MNSFSMWSLFTSDFVTALASIVLIVFSVLSWAVMIEKIRLFRIAKRNKPSGDADKVIAPYDKNLWFLAMVSGVAPFIGLFGTVWGVMDSFAAIGLNQSVSIGVIAPGLATALGTTALGLIAAIPAAIGYQVFTKKADDLYDSLNGK